MKSWPISVAKQLVDHLERAGFVVMKRPAEIGAAAPGRGFRECRPGLEPRRLTDSTDDGRFRPPFFFSALASGDLGAR